MTEGIIAALITGAVAVISSLLTQRKSAALILYRIDQLEKKQDKHNGLVEKTYRLEQKYAVLDNRQSASEHRIADLEKI